MTKFTDNDLVTLDEQFAKDGVLFHACPLQAAIELLRADF